MPIPGLYIREEQFKLSQTSVMAMDKPRTEHALVATGQELPKELPSLQGQQEQLVWQEREANLKQSAGSVQEQLGSFCLYADKGRLLPVCLGQQKP